jgi:anti-anti-sigma factor
MEIDVRDRDQVKVITLRGKLALGAAVDDLRQVLDDLLANGSTNLLLDLAEVPMLDSSGIGLLMRILTSAKKAGGAFKLLNPSKFSRQTLKLVGILPLFEVYEDTAQALASFQ